jgi:hypothetical protein
MPETEKYAFPGKMPLNTFFGHLAPRRTRDSAKEILHSENIRAGG